jgi:hypothetical protein
MRSIDEIDPAGGSYLIPIQLFSHILVSITIFRCSHEIFSAFIMLSLATLHMHYLTLQFGDTSTLPLDRKEQ